MKSNYKPLVIVGGDRGSLELPKLFKIPKDLWTPDSEREGSNRVLFVNLCESGEPEIHFWPALQEIQYFVSEILERGSELYLACGLSECYVTLDHYRNICNYLESHYPKLWSSRKFTFIIDNTTFLREEAEKFFKENNLKFIEIPAFRDLCWGVQEGKLAIHHVDANIETYLQIPVNDRKNKAFVRIRRPDDVRRAVILGILKDSALHSNCIFTYNMGYNGERYNPEDPLQVAFNSQDKGYNQNENGGFFVHEYNHEGCRSDFFLELVLENHSFTTEKSYKPMLLSLPAFYLGHRGTIKDLHNQGFKTFDKWWDESYDSYEFEDPRKVEAVLEEMKRILLLSQEAKEKMYREMIPVFRHNGMLLSKRSPELEKFVQQKLLQKKLI